MASNKYQTYQYTYGEYDEIAFSCRNDMNLAVWEGEGRLRLYNYNYDDTFRERVGRFIHYGLTHLWKGQKLTDLEVIVGEKVFKCHGLIMASASLYFEEILTSEDRADEAITLDESFVDPKVFQCLLDLIYEGKDTIQDDNIFDFMKAATFLKMRSLEFRILDLLCRKITERSCMQMWDWAEINNIQTLASKAKGVALRHFQVLRHTEDFLRMPIERLNMMLGHELLQYRYEDDILEGILDWAEFDADNRQQHLKELLPFVCFPFLSTRYLTELRKHPLIGLKSEYASYVDEALTYHLAALQKDGKKIQMAILRNQAKYLKRLMPGMRRVVILIGGEVIQDEPTTNVVACYLDMSHPQSRLGDVLQFSIATLPYPIGLQFASTVWKQDIFVSGGTRNPTSLLVFKPQENCWHILQSLPLGRENHAMVAVNGKLYVLGGRALSDAGHTVLSEVSEYDMETDTWKETGELPVAVEAAPAVTLFDKIYIFGGRDTTGHSMSVIQCLDIKTGQRGIIGELPTSVEGAKAIVVGKDIILVCPDGNIYKIYESSQKRLGFEDSFISDQQLLTPQLSLTEDEASNLGGFVIGSSWTVMKTTKPKKDTEDSMHFFGSSENNQDEGSEKDEETAQETDLGSDGKNDSTKGEEKAEEKHKEGSDSTKGEEKAEEKHKEGEDETEEAAAKENEMEEEESTTQKNEEETIDGEEPEECTGEEEKEEGELAAQENVQDESSADLKQLVPSDQPVSTIVAVKLAQMERRQNFGLFIRKVDVMVVGGQSENGNFLDDMLRIHIRSGQVNKADCKLVIPVSGMQVESTAIHQNYLMQFFDATSCFHGE